jgi:hypothetical protein
MATPRKRRGWAALAQKRPAGPALSRGPCVSCGSWAVLSAGCCSACTDPTTRTPDARQAANLAH